MGLWDLLNNVLGDPGSSAAGVGPRLPAFIWRRRFPSIASAGLVGRPAWQPCPNRPCPDCPARRPCWQQRFLSSHRHGSCRPGPAAALLGKVMGLSSAPPLLATAVSFFTSARVGAEAAGSGLSNHGGASDPGRDKASLSSCDFLESNNGLEDLKPLSKMAIGPTSAWHFNKRFTDCPSFVRGFTPKSCQ